MWIYSLADYQHIFALPEQELPKKILNFPAGISSVNAELYAQGHSIISGDEIYRLSLSDMQEHVKKLLQEKADYLRKNKQILLSTEETSVSQVIKSWQHSAELFLQDYELGKTQGRYQALSAAQLAESKEFFDLLLCADLLFANHQSATYSTRDLMNEFCHIATEIRIFPLSPEKNIISNELGPMMLDFQQRNYGIEVKAVNFPQRSDAHAMLRIWAKECKV